jgi:hypothetical protein
MSWGIKNVGWPIPYGDSWPISQKISKPVETPHLFEHRDQLYIQPYGYSYYLTELQKGRIINTWS